MNIIPKILNEDDLDPKTDEMVNHKDFDESETEIETHKSKERTNYPLEYDTDFPIVIILDDLNENQLNDPRVQAMFRLSGHSNISIFLITQRYYELPNRTLRANGNIYHIFKIKIFQRRSKSLSRQNIYGYDT